MTNEGAPSGQPAERESPVPLDTYGVLALSWNLSGGARSLIASFDFWAATLVWALASHYWLFQKWPDQVLSVLPGLLGFTLSGFAIFLSFGAEDFKALLAGKSGGRSPYLSVCAAFMWFVSIQLFALTYSLVANAMYFDPPQWLKPYDEQILIASRIGSGLGYWIFCYSLMLILRAAVRIFRLGRWYNDYMRILNDKPKK